MKFNELHPNIKVRIVETFISNCVSLMILPFMAIYFAGQFGAKITGLLMVGSILCSVIAGVYGGFFADKLGRKKMMIISESIRLVAFFLMAIVNSPWLESGSITYALFLITSFCAGLTFPAAQAMLIDCSNSTNRKFIYSIQYWSYNLALLIGGMLGGFFFEKYLFELLLSVSIASSLSLLLLIFFIVETYRPEAFIQNLRAQSKQNSNSNRPESKGMVNNYITILKDKTFLIFLTAAALTMSIDAVTRSYASVRLSQEMGERNLFSFGEYSFTVDGISMFGILQAENAFLVICFTLILTRFIYHLNDQWVLFTGILLCAGGYSVVGVSNLPGLLLWFMLLGSIGEIIYVAIKQSYLAEIVPDHNRGSYMAVSGLEGVIATIIGYLGISLGAFIPSWMMGIFIFLLGCTSLLLFRLVHPDIESHKQKNRMNQQALAEASKT